ncbi:MAG: glycoside hydrolase family 29, partial [Lentisphaerae bacterium]
LYWAPRFFRTARKYQKPGTAAWKLFCMDYDPNKFYFQESWNRHWYARCWELIEKYDPDMFNNDSPYPNDRRGQALGLKLFAAFLLRDRKAHQGRQTVVLSFKNAGMNRAAFTYNCERGMSAQIQKYPWLWATDLSGGWFYRKNARPRYTIPVLIGNVVDTISKNGIAMLNVALRGDGTLPENQANMLRALGKFLDLNAEAVYGTRPWRVYGEGPTRIQSRRGGENIRPYTSRDIRFTCRGNDLYTFVLAPPKQGNIMIQTLREGGPLSEQIQSISLLGSDASVHWTRSAKGLRIECPRTLPQQPVIVFKLTLAKKP